jgi:uncharacterized phage infection (PIP) family protein YhgE
MSLTKKTRTDSSREVEDMNRANENAVLELKELFITKFEDFTKKIEIEIREVKGDVKSLTDSIDEMKYGIRRLEDSNSRIEDGLRNLQIKVESIKDDTSDLKTNVKVLDERTGNINDNIKKLEKTEEKKTISTGKIKERLVATAVISAVGTLATVLTIAAKLFFPSFPFFN